MPIKIFETRNNLEQKLKTRGLSFKSDELQKSLIDYNYFNLFNGLETLFLNSPKPKNFKGASLQDFKNLYEFDRALRVEILRCLDRIESKIKSSVAHHFSSKYCFDLNRTMEYTNKNNYMNPQDGTKTSPTYCKYSGAYPFCSEQNKKCYKNFNNFFLFDSDYLRKLVHQYDHIDPKVYSDSRYSPPSSVATYLYSSGTKGSTISVAVPLWVAIETFTFGSLIWLLHYLKDDVMTEVLKDFGLHRSKRFDFLNILDIFLDLRNKCAHGFLINRFRTPNRIKINKNLIRVFNLNYRYKKPGKSSSPHGCIIRLFDVMKILGYFEDLTKIKKILKKILYMNNRSLGWKRAQQINSNLLNRMGEADYKEWKNLLVKKSKYVL